MQIWKLTGLALAASLTFVPQQAHAQVSGSITFGAPQRSWGHEVVITNYAPERFGDWHTSYRHWKPVTVYVVNGRYYPHHVRGARAVVVYRSHDQFFLPPREPAWNNFDRRYDYRHRPVDEDYNRPPPRP